MQQGEELEVVICKSVGFDSGFKGSNQNRMFVKSQEVFDRVVQEMGIPGMRISVEHKESDLEDNSPGSFNGCRKGSTNAREREESSGPWDRL
jgi:hypothetical protein